MGRRVSVRRDGDGKFPRARRWLDDFHLEQRRDDTRELQRTSPRMTRDGGRPSGGTAVVLTCGDVVCARGSFPVRTVGTDPRRHRFFTTTGGFVHGPIHLTHRDKKNYRRKKK